ncbi:Maf family nucleotide pyrophosphatase [Bifidobacterium tsurumiense]|uniref:Maf family nucleotide pyrophosphatase n=1 Tax=Bifidobacterium tsurumiense TaxID=356829 RepID=UPI0012B38130|nr:Maf family nucleotide pyrophosphatase [Bifidobacterium tsurumiense]MDY4677774.1 Maf family nucleotide pyrophosphatase [Bifidobacterium tsurumiense]MSS12445.1 septum formation protein Maf [Bifidobacterium tsurumiense]
MSVSIILASQSMSRRNVLYSAGISPTIRVSHVDEPEVLRSTALERGVAEEQLSIEDRVMILAQAKAQAVFDAYRSVMNTAASAQGDHITAFPLESQEAADSTAQPVAEDAENIDTTTRDFSAIEVPTSVQPLTDVQHNSAGLKSQKVGPLIIGCDSMFLIDGEVQGKPHIPEVAVERLRRMRGNSGELWTGHCVIDLATGKSVQGSSHAVVKFGQYSDRDIERYVATGEPLEVAGNFTLEGLGGAFVDGIEGDPHGVMGISLPLLRTLVAQLGVDWTDVWNVLPEATTEKGPEQLAKESDPPQENVMQPGDGWVQCACGRRHWGLNGAAGVLLARTDEHSGEVTHVVMQHRAMWSAEGGTWGIPGGAIADGENAIEGALRESSEEAGIDPEDIEVVGTYCEDHGPWRYTTVFALEKPGHKVHPQANDDESMEVAWIPLQEVPHRKLLTAMRTDWPRFAQRLNDLAAQYRS